MTAFTIGEGFSGGWTFVPTEDLARVVGTLGGSYTVLPARLFGLSYCDYCRMVRDVYRASLSKGKGWYIGVYFLNKVDCLHFIKELNRRFAALVKE